MQTIKTQLTLTIPENLVLIDLTEFQELKRQELIGTYWTMKDLELRINKKFEWIKDNILYPSKFRKILDVKNGGFVYYPEKRGQTWVFKATAMAEFLEIHFAEIFGGI